MYSDGVSKQLLVALVLLLAPAVPAGGSGQTPDAAFTLAGAATQEQRLAGGERHRYTLELTAGPWRVAVEQAGLDVVLELWDGAGEGPRRVDMPLDSVGIETLLIDAPAAAWRLEVRPRDPTAAGRYRLHLERLADADRRRIAAEDATWRAAEQSAEGTPEAYRRALAHYREAAGAWRQLGERRPQAQALQCMANLHHRLDEHRTALELFEEALALWRGLGDRGFEATALNDAAVVHQELGDAGTAVELYVRARNLYRQLGDSYSAAVTHNNLCFLEQRRGALEEARDCFLETLPTLRRAGVRQSLATLLNNLGGVHYQLGEPDAARRYFSEALELRRVLGDLEGEAQLLNNLASLERYLGAWQKALSHYGRALELRRRAEDRRGEAKVLNNLGYAYLNVGELDRAQGFFESALALRRALGDRGGQAVTLTNLGSVYHQRGNPAKALAFRRKALELRQALGKPRDVARTHLWLARDLRALGDPSAALAELERALAIFPGTGDRRFEARAHSDRGRLLLELGRPGEALDDLRLALDLARQVRDAAGEAETLVTLAETQRRLGDLEAARGHARAAVERLETLRTGVGIPQLRATFLAARHRAYELDVALAMELHRRRPGEGHDSAGLEASERAHARALLDLLSASRIDPERQIDPALARRRTRLEERWRFLAQRRLRVADGPRAAALDRQLHGIAAELDRVEGDIRRQHPRVAGLARPQVLDAAAIAALLDPETALIEIALGEHRSFLWWITPTAVDSFELPGRAEIESLALAAHRRLAAVEHDLGGNAGSGGGPLAALGRLLLGPLAGRLASQRLVVVADGALHLLPFATLPRPTDAPGAGRGPLLLHHEVVQLPSASVLALLRRPPRPAPRWAAAVLADPIFGPGSPHSSGFDRLPYSGREAAAIRELLPAGQIFLALGADADREAVLGDAFGDAGVVHFATHGVIDTERPQLSGLVLSQTSGEDGTGDGFLSLRDIYGLRLAAELVVLSGCRTALGKAVRGEGLVGLTRGFMHAGAPRVIASLWRVEDRATAELMSRFYRALWEEGAPPAAALRAAQLAMRTAGRYRDPYYWAGFVIQGDWR